MNRVIVTYCLSLMIVQSTFGQENLVLNPGFEDYVSLPDGYVKDGYSHVKFWHVPTESSPDYYHRNNNFWHNSIPNNDFGFHPAYEGNGYIGLFPFKWDGYMEHITGLLSSPLIKGEKYEVSFYVRFAGRSCRFVIEGIGVYFSKKIYPFKGYTPPFYQNLITSKIQADIQSLANYPLRDTAWVKVSGFYVARGGEKYITLGKFYDQKITLSLIERFIKLSLNNKKKERFYKKHNDILPFNPEFDPKNDYAIEAPYYFIDQVTVRLDTTNVASTNTLDERNVRSER